MTPAPAPPPAIRFDRVNKWHGAAHVLRDLSLSVATGERLVLCGPSGSGKSTALRCVNQLERHQSGRIEVDGIEVTAAPRALARVRREVGMVFQSFNLFPHLTVLENCTLAPVRVRGLGRAEAEAEAMALLARVRIAEQARKRPAQLSGGQQQRAAIARALCMRPRAMLFDEPTSALDPEMAHEVLDVMTDLARTGMTMICVTHEMGFARAFADRVAFLDRGEVLEHGPPEAVLGEPRHERLRAFLGRGVGR